MNSLSNSFNHYSRTFPFDSHLNSNISDDGNINGTANMKDNTKFMENIHSQNGTNDINNVWTKGSFKNKSKSKPDLSLNITAGKISWSSQNSNYNNNNNFSIKTEDDDDDMDTVTNDTNNLTSPTLESGASSPSHHARRPMNAFLIFCKKHRPIVRRKFPNLENRGVTRILGEWWALLDDNDKNPYKDLAKEYKDAFFCANPNFKWYKLPAPPLRTLATRPGSVQKEPILLSHSPTQLIPPHESEFTPGKLADESQLGSLSALLNVNNFNKTNDTGTKINSDIDIDQQNNSFNNNNNNNNNNNITENSIKVESYLESPPSFIKDSSLPPKPIKKRKFIENYLDNTKNSVRNIFETKDISDDQQQPDLKSSKIDSVKEESDSQDSITNKELIEKIIDNSYQNQNTVPHCSGYTSGDLSKEPRKSGRSCKGKLYAEFMVNGKLIKNKREKRSNSSETLKNDDESPIVKTETKSDILPNFDLQNTIKRLAERTKVNIDQVDEKPEQKIDIERLRTNSESSEDSYIKNKFDLQKRIDELPCLDYDNYMQRKRENKKKKFTKNKVSHLSIHQKQKSQTDISPVNINNNNPLTGSKKRKNKLSITHLENKDSPFARAGGGTNVDDLSGLATLAEIASNKEKINQE